MATTLLLLLASAALCHGKVLRLAGFPARNGLAEDHSSTELPRSSSFQLPSVDHVPQESEKTKRIADAYRRSRRALVDARPHESGLEWEHAEQLDEGLVLRWTRRESSIAFRVEARTRGYVGVGFNSVAAMRGADLVVAWVDDRSGTAHILDCHGLEHGGAAGDQSQNYELVAGHQNHTYTTVEFRRPLDTCDPDDFTIADDTIQVLWALGPDGSDGELPVHVSRGARPLRLLQPPTQPRDTYSTWTPRIRNLTIPNNMATLFWCKVFKAPELSSKHHIVGYRPIIDSRPLASTVGGNTHSPVHHMVLYECAEDAYTDRRTWASWVDGDGYYGPSAPREWAVCLTPVAAWAVGSRGEFLPENVGIPLGERGGSPYYMLEVHYDNQALHEVIDNSGIEIHYTSSLREHDAALLGSGVAVSALHVIPPRQSNYKTVGICNTHCSDKMIPDEGINIVSVLLHAHGAAKKIALKHIRADLELPVISEENRYDARYQQSRQVVDGRRFERGDTLLTECTYDTSDRDKPTLGGYSDTQEMCLSFILYYPRTELAGCYSMTPVKEFFETFGVKEFYHMNMTTVENMFLSRGPVETSTPPPEVDFQPQDGGDDARQGDDQGVGLLKELVIAEPAEFVNKTFMSHLNSIPWREPLLTKRIEDRLYRGAHMTFCKKRDDSLAIPVEIQVFPQYTAQPLVGRDSGCARRDVGGPSATRSLTASAHRGQAHAVSLALVCMALVLR